MSMPPLTPNPYDFSFNPSRDSSAFAFLSASDILFSSDKENTLFIRYRRKMAHFSLHTYPPETGFTSTNDCSRCIFLLDR